MRVKFIHNTQYTCIARTQSKAFLHASRGLLSFETIIMDYVIVIVCCTHFPIMLSVLANNRQVNFNMLHQPTIKCTCCNCKTEPKSTKYSQFNRVQIYVCLFRFSLNGIPSTIYTNKRLITSYFRQTLSPGVHCSNQFRLNCKQ